MTKVLTFLCAAGGKIHSNACVEVSQRSDTQRHMLERRRYAWKEGTAARDNRFYCCQNFAACTTRWFSKVSSIAREMSRRGGGSFQTALPFSTVAKSLRENSCMGNASERGGGRETRKSDRKKRRERKRGWRRRERSRRKLWKAFPRFREKFVIENRGVYANVRAYLNETGTH